MRRPVGVGRMSVGDATLTLGGFSLGCASVSFGTVAQSSRSGVDG